MCGLLNMDCQALNSLFLLSFSMLIKAGVCFYLHHFLFKALCLNADLSFRGPLIKLSRWYFYHYRYCSHRKALIVILLLVYFSLILSLLSSITKLNSHFFQQSWTLHLRMSIVNLLFRHQRRSLLSFQRLSTNVHLFSSLMIVIFHCFVSLPSVL